MAIKILNNSVINNDGTIVADKIRLGNVNNQPTLTDEILVHDGAGNARLQHLEIDTSTVTFSGSGTGSLNTDIVAEGTTNLYYTDARVDANFATKTTTDLTEGTNLYYTDTRVRNVLTADSIANTTYVDQAEADAISSANAYTDAAVISGTGSLTTDDIAEATNLYYTDTRARSAISASGDLSYNSTTGVISYTIPTTIASLSNHTTDALAEGVTNLYFTTARFSAHFDLNLLTKNTDDLTEGTNLYYTDARARSALSASGDIAYNPSTGVISYTTPTTIASLSNHTTSALAEGTNLYYTDARVGTYLTTNSYATETYVNNALAAQASAGYDLSANDTDDLLEGASNLYFTNERVDDRVADLLVAGTNITLTYNDTAGTITIDAAADGGYDLSSNDTDDLAEGATNLYYTNARARGAISVTGSGTYNSTTGVIDIQGGVTSVNSQTGAVTLTTSNISEGTNLYYTNTRATSAARAAISVSGSLSYNPSTGVISYTTPTTIASLSNHTTTNLAEGTNLYFTNARARSAISASGDLSYNSTSGVISYTIPTTIASLSNHTTDVLAEGTTNLYYTTARANSAIDARVTKLYVDALNIEAASVAADSVALGTDTTGNYVATIAGTTNEISVSGSGTENAAVTIGLPSNVTISNNLTVSGDLYVAGSTVTVGAENLSVDDNFIYLNQGDAIDPTDITFTGSGLDDMVFRGSFEGSTATTYYVRIDSTGSPDTFEWSKDNFSTTEATGIAITGGAQLLDNNISVQFLATTGHTLNDTWSATASPLDIDTGIFTNRNSGTTGPGYTHQGIFYDVSDSKWRIFSEYDNEPNGNVDTSHASYVAGTFVADTFEGNLTGNAATATKLATTRTISLSGDATGSANFDGSVNATITVTVADNSHNHTIANVSGLSSYTDMLDSATSSAVNGSLAVRHFSTGNISATSFTGALVGNASTASALQTARTIALTGDVTGSVNFDGSANVSITTAVANNSHTHTSTNITDFAEAVQDTVGAAIVGANAIDATYDDGLGTITISHTDTSTASSLTALTGANVISDIDIDTYGHITAMATRALTPANIGAAAASHTHTSANITDFAEAVQDIIGADVVAGTGISVSYNDTTGDTTITNTAPDQTVTIAGSGATSVSGTYPNFTISSTDTNTTYSAGTGISLGGTTFSLNLNGLSTSTADADGDYFAVVDTSGSQHKLTKANINLTGFNNNAGWTSNTGTVTSVSAGSYLTGGTITTSGTLAVDATSTNTVSKVVARDASGNFSAGTITAALSGNASTATKLATARTISLSGDATGSASFDGSANATLTVTVADNSHNHTIANIGGLSSYTDMLDNATSSAVNGSLAVRHFSTGNISATSFTGELVGNASTATKLATARTISLSGDATGSASFDGSANATITVVVANDSHTHDGRYYTETEADSRFVNVTGDTMTGSLTIGTIVGSAGTLNVTGNITATGEVTAYSDRRFKHNIATIENALDKVVALRGVNYEKDDRYSMGVIAQEVETVIPEVVYTDAEGMKSVAYGNIVGVLIEAIKEQQQQITDLQKRLDELQK